VKVVYWLLSTQAEYEAIYVCVLCGHGTEGKICTRRCERISCEREERKMHQSKTGHSSVFLGGVARVQRTGQKCYSQDEE
jgi:hypothetical protein